jgi:hypothetical protein
MENINNVQYRASLEKLLSDRDLRILFWRILTEECHVFQEDYPTNAQAYSLLAEQRIGKRLLADAKRVSPTAVLTAEAEYNEFMERVLKLAETINREGDD